MADLLFKLCLFGDGGVGKTTLVNRYMTGVFTEGTSMTIGVEFRMKTLMVGKTSVSLQIWDFAGEDRFISLLPAYMRGASGGIFMYDITRYLTFKKLTHWMEVVRNGTDDGDIPLFMLGGKVDLKEGRAVPREIAISIAEKNGFVGFAECSAKTGQNVEISFETIAEIMLQRSELIH